MSFIVFALCFFRYHACLRGVILKQIFNTQCGEDPKSIYMLWCPHLVFRGSPWPQLHSVYVTSSQQPGLACSPSNFGVGFSRASGLRPEARTDFSGFQGGTQANSSLLGFRIKVLGLFLGCAPSVAGWSSAYLAWPWAL